MDKGYYTDEQVTAYIDEHKVSLITARRALVKLGYTHPPRSRKNYPSLYYTEAEALALSQQRNISLASAKNYLVRNYKGPKKGHSNASMYYTNDQLEDYMRGTGKSRQACMAILRYRALNPHSYITPGNVTSGNNAPVTSFTEEQIYVYMYQSGLLRSDALQSMCQEQITVNEYAVEYWVLQNNKWQLLVC
jgi:hypothetical protein